MEPLYPFSHMACIIELCSRILNATKWHMMQFSRRCPVPKGPHPEHHHLRRGACALGTGFFVNASDDSGFQSFCTTTGTQRVTSLTSLGPMSGLCGYRKSKLRHLHRANLIGWKKCEIGIFKQELVWFTFQKVSSLSCSYGGDASSKHLRPSLKCSPEIPPTFLRCSFDK